MSGGVVERSNFMLFVAENACVGAFIRRRFTKDVARTSSRQVKMKLYPKILMSHKLLLLLVSCFCCCCCHCCYKFLVFVLLFLFLLSSLNVLLSHFHDSYYIMYTL